ncbi:MAG: HD-GYP domain-containing protein [Nitrosomonas sp.]|nr:HD-GYP domain-containing protein [Nitrosomonas sp.]MDP1949562.1 HD-GYP domain-containing protein [Nitrosomonas sp.]
MLKKIKVTDARLGIYLHDICGKWIEHPFWIKQFQLTKQKDLDKLTNSGLKEIWIDTSKGIDIVVSVAGNSKPSEPEPPEPRPDKQPKETAPVAKKSDPHVSLQEELVVAKKLHAKTKNAVIAIFNELRMGNVFETEVAEQLVDEINKSVARNGDALLSLIRLKNADEYTYLHSVAVCVLMIALGKQLGLEDNMLKQVGIAGLLHDIGKVRIPSEVLNKPGKLTDDEFDLVKTHSLRGWEILKESSGISEQALDVCLHHHERVDGNGYPDKLSGEALTLFARMGAVCDVYDAITSDRCYKKGWEPAESIRKMASWKEGHFDEAVFHAFVKTIGIYPNGTLLKLESGRLGVVIEQSKKKLTTPFIKVFFSIRSNAHIPVEIIDLSKSQDRVASVEQPLQWGFDLDKFRDIVGPH